MNPIRSQIVPVPDPPPTCLATCTQAQLFDEIASRNLEVVLVAVRPTKIGPGWRVEVVTTCDPALTITMLRAAVVMVEDDGGHP